jgi:hypothetical protein
MTRHDRFTRYDNGTVLDTCTHLVWMTQDYYNLEGNAPPQWDKALAWPVKMNQQCYGGYSDWRTATLAEYKTIYNPQKPKRSYRKKPVGYPDAFADGGGEWCWTEEVAGVGTGHIHTAYTFSFIWGTFGKERVDTIDHPQPTYHMGSIRLVRGALSTSMLSAAK